MLLKLAMWTDVEEYLQKRNDVILPVGSTEQHGPGGPLGTDLIAAEELASELGEERRALVAPALPFALSSLHGAFPGTISLRPMTLAAVIRDAIGSLAEQGFERFFVVNAHPATAGLLEAVCGQLQADRPKLRCLVASWWQLSEVRAEIRELFGSREGFQGTPSELSLVRKFYPRGALDLPPPLNFEPVVEQRAFSPADFRARYPDGRVGSDPSLAQGGAGDRLFAVATRALIELHRRLVEEP